MKYKRLAFFDANGFDVKTAEGEQSPPDSLLLIRYGKTSYTKAGERGEFEFTEEDANKVIADFTSRGRDIVIDFEHQSLSGEKAPAAGWIDELLKTTEGLLARVKYWTDEATEYLKKGEYRYFSPTLYFSRSGRNVSAVHSVALTNHPAMHNIPALVADDSCSGGEFEDMCRENNTVNNKRKEETETMNQLPKLMELLSLSESGNYRDETEQINAVSAAILELLESREKFTDFLNAHHFSDIEDASGKIAEMVPPEEKLKLEAEVAQGKAQRLVAEAFSEGKIAEAKRTWAENFALKDPEAFAEWIKDAPVIIPDNKETDDAKKKATETEFTEKELEIFRLLGIDKNKIKQMKGAE